MDMLTLLELNKISKIMVTWKLFRIVSNIKQLTHLKWIYRLFGVDIVFEIVL